MTLRNRTLAYSTQCESKLYTYSFTAELLTAFSSLILFDSDVNMHCVGLASIIHDIINNADSPQELFIYIELLGDF